MKKRSSSQSSWALLTGSVADARVESHRIRHLVNRGQKIVENSVAKEHLYEVAGDLIMGIPERLSHLERLLDRTSYALSLMGEDFFRGRLSIDDKEMVDQAVKFSQSAFPSTVHRVASRFLMKKAGVNEVIARAKKFMDMGKITKDEYESIVLEHTKNPKPNMSGRLAGILYGRARFSSYKHTDIMINTKEYVRGGNPNGEKVRKPNFNVVNEVILESHALYRLELRDITIQEINLTLNGWSNMMNRGYYDDNSGLSSRENTDNAKEYRVYAKMGNRGSKDFFFPQTGLTLVIGSAQAGTTNRFNVFVVSMYKGQNDSGGYRSRFAYRPPASELPGASTWVNEDSKKNLTPNTSKGVGDNAESRERSGPQTTENKQQALPIRNDHSDKRDQKMPISQTDGQGTARPQFNTPPDSENAEGGRSIHKDKVRTKSLPGDEYGTPYKDDGYSLTRRTMKGSIVSLANRYLSERNER